MIFDTSFIIDIMNNDVKAVEKLHELIKKGEPLLVTAPTLFELFSGMTRSEKPEQEKNKIESILKGQVIVAMDPVSAEKAGEIDGLLTKEGKQIEVVDSMIAGIALTKHEKVLTRNVKDFSRVKNITVESY